MRLQLMIAAAALMLSAPVFAASKVVEGDEAKQLYDAQKTKAQVLVQKDGSFHLRKPGAAEEDKPATLTVKAGELFFITNEEMAFVHNVYDETDASWVLKKQVPSSVAALAFDTPGEHKLRCAIHPKMQVTVMVTP
jgi:plastocyanin